MPIAPLPPDLPGKESEADRVIAKKVNELVTEVNKLTETPPIPPPVEDWLAEKPRSTVDVTYHPSTGSSFQVDSDAAMRAAINSAVDGDEIVILSPIVGNFTVAGKKLTIRGNNLPPVGKRVIPSTDLVSVRTGAATPVFSAVDGAQLRLVGLNIGAIPELKITYSLIEFGRGTETAINALPHNCIVDRCIVLGHSELDVRRGVRLDGVSCAVVDSTIDEIHTTADGCAIFSANGPGPFGAYNSLLGSSGENFMFGGADAKIPNILPSDITISRCHIRKNPDWANQRWQLKNLGEMKVGRRALYSQCVFENNVVSTQPGYALVLSATDQDRTAPWSTVEDITMEWCEYRNVMAFGNLTGWVYDPERFWTKRVSIRDSFVQKLTPGPGIAVLLQRHTEDIEVIRCSFERCDYCFAFEGGAKLDGGLKGIRIKNNVASCWTPFHCPEDVSTDAMEGFFDAYAPDRDIKDNTFAGFNDPLPSGGVNRTELDKKLAGVV